VQFRKLVSFAATAALILLFVCLPACRTTNGPGSVAAQSAPADLTFTQEGQTYVLVNGDAFKVGASGERQFVTHLYDPDFFAKNYTTKDGQVFQKDPESGTLYPVTRNFEDGFEDFAGLMTPPRWHHNNTDPARAGTPDNYYNLGNRIAWSPTVKHSGVASLRFYARPSSKTVSKASLMKNIMYFKKGDHLYFSGWFFLQKTPSIYDGGGFTLVDFESSFMQAVGLRIIFRKNDALSFELELPKTEFNQDSGSEVSFPTERWVHVQAHALLSDQAGLVQIWQDGKKVLDKPGRTLPLADTVYDRVEVGISALAKGAKYEKILYVDDVVISDSDIP
jgi:hypothetical protein